MSETTPLLPSPPKSPSTCCKANKKLDYTVSPCCRASQRSHGAHRPIPVPCDDDYCYLADQKWEYKAIALACALFLAVGSHFAAHTLGAMKNIVKQEYGITNSQYGVIQSSVALVNTVLPVIGGIFIDAFGTVPGSMITTLLITSGNVLVAWSTSSTSLSMMIVGRILYGIGSGTVVIAQETILSQWFRGRSLAVVVALMLTVSRLASFLAQATVIPIANWSGWYGYGFWFSALLCVFSLIVNIGYVALLKTVTSPGIHCQKQAEVIKRKKSFSWSKLLYLPHSYWLIAAMEFLLGGGWGCFLHINSEFVKLRFGYSDAHAAAVASVAQIMPVALMPLLGMCVDRYGKRTWMMIGSGLTFFVAMALLGFTATPPVIGMLLFSVSLSLGPVGLVSSIPVILPLHLVGTGMGLVKSSTNVGAAIFDITTGRLQDADAHQGYGGVVIFFLVISLLAVAAGLTLAFLDRYLYRGILDRSHQRSQQKPTLVDHSPVTTPLRAGWCYGAIFISLVVLSWTLFIQHVFFSPSL